MLKPVDKARFLDLILRQISM